MVGDCSLDVVGARVSFTLFESTADDEDILVVLLLLLLLLLFVVILDKSLVDVFVISDKSCFDPTGEGWTLAEGVLLVLPFTELLLLVGLTVLACWIASELIIKWIIGGVDKSNNCYINY